MTIVMETRGLTKRYGADTAISDVSLRVKKGQVFGMLGPNGSGKTTTLGILLGVTRPDAGSFSWFGREGRAGDRRRIGSILEQPAHYPWLSAERNLYISAVIRDIKDPGPAIAAALEAVNLGANSRQCVKSFSLGMRQRLALAAALLGGPEVLVLDEPNNGVDPKGIAIIRSLIRDYASRGKTVILASHILAELEKVCTDIAILNHGRVINQGPVEEALRVSDYLEVSASNMSALEHALQSFANDSSYQRVGELFHVYTTTKEPATKLGEHLFNKGVALSHLSHKTRSLESHFLQTLKEGEAKKP